MNVRHAIPRILLAPSLLAALWACKGDEPEPKPEPEPAAAVEPAQAATDGPAAATESPVQRRSDIDCADYLKRTDEAEPLGNMSSKTRAGDWGGLQAAFQKLPEGAELCGAGYLVEASGKVLDAKGNSVTTYFRSKLGIEQLEAFYGPIATAAGCKPMRNPTPWGRMWGCPADKGIMLNVGALPEFNVYFVSTMKP